MFQLLETIKVKENQIQNIAFHNARVNYSRKSLFNASDEWDLSTMIDLPALDNQVIYKCRVLYSLQIEKTEFIPYTIKKPERLYLIDAGDVDYSFKYSDRSSLEHLKSSIPDSGIADILIIKNGLITDTSFTNVALYDGNDWYTPAHPLLKGTKRAFLVQTGIIKEKDIRPENLQNYSIIRLINAMIDWEDGVELPVDKIYR